jgi:hypothetical protein
MKQVLAVNGSPRCEKGNTATILAPLMEGMANSGCSVKTVYSDRYEIRPCDCGSMRCWYRSPGRCYIRDGMDDLYPKLSAADILVLATPVYIPLPGVFQSLLNRLCPLIVPELEMRSGRTRARLREGVAIKTLVGIVTTGWWERGNGGVVSLIFEELAANLGVPLGAVLVRPHIGAMWHAGSLTEEGAAVVAAARQAGIELATHGSVSSETTAAVERPLATEQEYREASRHWAE